MPDKVRKSFIKKHFSVAQLVSIFLSAIVFLGLEVFVFRLLRDYQLKNEMSEVAIFGENLSAGINIYLQQIVNKTQEIENLYLEYGDSFVSDFSKVVSQYKENDDLVRGFFLAPDGIVQAYYPPSLYDSLGFDIFKDTFQSKKAIQARDSGEITFEGPVYLKEGIIGLATRNPIYKDGVFKGFSVITIDWNGFTNKIAEYFNLNSKSDYIFSIWKNDSSDAITMENGSLFSNTEENVSDLFKVKLRIPNDEWYLSVEPKKHWGHKRDFYTNFLVFTLVLSIMILFFWYKQFEAINKAYNIEHDFLTGLYTRSAFYRYATKWLKECPDISFDLLMIDIEAFKVINSIHGTKKCDEFLVYLANIILEENPISICGRYGGDQFVYILPSSEIKGKLYLESRVSAVLEDAPIKNVNIKFGYIQNVDRKLPMNLICDRALLAARSILHNFDVVVASYNGEFSKKQLNKQMIESSFDEALKNGEFKVWYQPKFDAITEKFVGAEALVRWIKKDGTIVSPTDFIYIFEEDGLIVNLDEYVFRTVCETIKTWLSKGVKVLPISVNLSRTSLHHKGIVKKYKTIVERVGIPIEYVPLEITESMTFGNEQIKNLAEELRKEGFRIDMDDFGTGSSSLASLNILPFDVIKLDKSLIDYIGTPYGEELLRHSIELAHFKNIKVVAEGVESEKQLQVLRNLGCDTIQGYYYKPPMSYEEGVEYLSMLYVQNRV